MIRAGYKIKTFLAATLRFALACLYLLNVACVELPGNAPWPTLDAGLDAVGNAPLADTAVNVTEPMGDAHVSYDVNTLIEARDMNATAVDATLEPPDVSLSDVAPLEADAASTEPCNTRPEVCDGIDNDCDGTIDEAGRATGTCDCSRVDANSVFVACGTPVDWVTALSACAARGGTLAVLRNARESEALNEGLLALEFGLNSVRRQAWIGFNDRQTEGQFVWADGDPSQYTNWASLQPDDYQMNEDCVAVRGLTGYRWNDYGCDLPLPFICREEAD